MGSDRQEDPLTGCIRAIAICVFRNDRRILVGEGYGNAPRELDHLKC
jgi:hypothetical protein